MIIGWVQNSIPHIDRSRSFEIVLGAEVVYRLPQQLLVYLLFLLVVVQPHHIALIVNL